MTFREPKKPLTLNLPVSVYNRLQELADADCRKKSSMVRWMINEWAHLHNKLADAVRLQNDWREYAEQLEQKIHNMRSTYRTFQSEMSDEPVWVVNDEGEMVQVNGGVR